jgi:MULE transposase domain
MPLALFDGVNHHGQTVVLACALIQKEYDDSYCWVFSKFLECMENVRPGAILTDQCKSIENGVRLKLPGVLHRFCAWHITHKLSSKWGRTDDKEKLNGIVKAVVYHSLSPSEFEKNWNKAMKEIGYENDTWFKKLFTIRDKWIPVYLNHRFWAGMTTTQRAESMNAFLSKYLRKKSTLGQFVVQFECALKRLFEREIEADHESKYKSPKLFSSLPMEMQLRDSYTNYIFYKCQEEIMHCANLTSKLSMEVDGVSVYLVTDYYFDRDFEVKFNTVSKNVECICQLFESMGILCCHCIYVLKQENIICIDQKYIIDRWRKDFKRTNLSIPDYSFTDLPEGENRYNFIFFHYIDN